MYGARIGNNNALGVTARCGTVLDGDETVQECGARVFELMLRVASGERTKSEAFDFGAAEFAPWVIGATM